MVMLGGTLQSTMTSPEVVTPKSEEQIADIVRAAAERKGSFEVVGHGTKRAFGRLTEAGTMLDTSALSGIVKYEPEELVITVRAATPVAEIEAALAGKRQMLGFSPADWGPLFGATAGQATLAGIVGANACGARRVKAGAVRDHVIGCRFVNGDGEAIKAGGPVIKNVTGFDVPKLMCGAFGTLGLLTEVTLRVSPAPARVAALAVRADSEDGLRVLREAMRLPLDPTGLAYIPDVFPSGEPSAGPHVAVSGGAALIRVEGNAQPLNDKLDTLRAHFASHETIVLDDDVARSLFRDVDNCGLLAASDSAIWRLCVPPSEAHAALDAAKPDHWYADWAGGLLWLGLPATAGIASRLRALTARLGGHATLMRGSADARGKLDVFEPEPPARSTLSRNVKKAFDPNRVFNPGRMYKDI
jgi:glycolate oxidase FAD binding subunit